MSVSWIRVYSKKFEPNLFIVIKQDKYGEPCFGIIKYIVVNSVSDEVLIICNKIQSTGYYDHIKAYLLDPCVKQESHVLINLKDIRVLPAAAHRRGEGQKCISVMKQNI